MSVITIYRGDTPKFNFAIKNRDGSAFDLSGAKVYFTAKSPGASEVLFDLTCTITDEDEGLAEVRLTAAQSGTVGGYAAEVEIRVTSGPDTFIYTATQFSLVIADDIRK